MEGHIEEEHEYEVEEEGEEELEGEGTLFSPSGKHIGASNFFPSHAKKALIRVRNRRDFEKMRSICIGSIASAIEYV